MERLRLLPAVKAVMYLEENSIIIVMPNKRMVATLLDKEEGIIDASRNEATLYSTERSKA
jgi:hypothetical protein